MITKIQLTPESAEQYAIVLPESATAETVTEMHHALNHVMQILLGNEDAIRDVTIETGYNIMELLDSFVQEGN